MTVGFKTRIYPDKQQTELLSYYCRVSHDMYNFLVEKFHDNLPHTTMYGIKDYHPQDLMRDFGKIIPQRIVLGVLKTYAWAVERWWNKLSNPPKFHKYNPNKQSFYLSSCTRSIHNDYIPLPLLQSQNIEISKHILIDTQIIKTFNIAKVIEPRFTFQHGEWYLSGSYKIPDVKKREKLEFIGLDWGIKNFMTSSNGELINYPPLVLREYQRIRKLKHYLDKKEYGSKNWCKLHNKMIIAYERFENLKNDFIEKTTTRLCKNNNIAIEDLSGISFLKGKKFIRRANVIAPRYRFIRKLQWKCEKFGSTLVQVEPAYTSRTCSCCGCVKETLDLSERIFICECGNIMDRDVNAARNIAARAICCSH